MFERLINKILRQEKVEGIIEVSLVSDLEIRRLNQKFRKKDQPTDVLSFYLGEDGFIGDIIISPETAKKNASLYGLGYRQELKRLVVHGVLHLLGYQHGRRMRHAEEIYQKF